MNIALYDGNNSELKQIKSCIRALDNYEYKLETFGDKSDLLARIHKNRKEFDIYFLSIDSDTPDGLKVAEEIRKVNLAALIIFMSQDDSQMSNVFAFHAFDYLLRPVAMEQIEISLKRARKYLGGNQAYVEFSFKREKFVLLLDEIIYVTKSGRIAYIHTKDEIYKSYLTMSEIVTKLSDGRFIRVHGSYVINLNYVTRIVRDEVFLCTFEDNSAEPKEAAISISRRFKEDFQKSIEGYRIPYK